MTARTWTNRGRLWFGLALIFMAASAASAEAPCPHLSGTYRGEGGATLEVEQQGCRFIVFREKNRGKEYSAELTGELHLGPATKDDQNIGTVALWSAFVGDTLVMQVLTLDKDDEALGRQMRSVLLDGEKLVVATVVEPVEGKERTEVQEWHRTK